jgi:hypothetical protein
MCALVTVWCGNRPFSLNDNVCKRAVCVGREYVDSHARPHTRRDVDVVAYGTELAALHQLAHRGSDPLVDELEFRWANSEAPCGLYVITHEVEPRFADGYFIADGKPVGRRVWATKVGRALRSLAGRLAVYEEKQYRDATICEGSISLRVAIYGSGPAMPSEPQIQAVARVNAPKLFVTCADGITRAVSTETFFGTDVVVPLTRFAEDIAA